MAGKKYYTVWKGVNPGVYDSWTDCQLQIKGFKGALYKSFNTREEAEHAFASPAHEFMNTPGRKSGESTAKKQEANLPENFNFECIAVDAACSGNPGMMEYRGVYLRTGEQIFGRTDFPLRTGLWNKQYR